MTIRFDRSDSSGILILCSECTYWHAFRFGQYEAYLAAEGHDVLVHDVPAEVADNARTHWEKRRAARS